MRDLRTFAYHECGHAVAMLQLGWSFEEIALKPSPEVTDPLRPIASATVRELWAMGVAIELAGQFAEEKAFALSDERRRSHAVAMNRYLRHIELEGGDINRALEEGTDLSRQITSDQKFWGRVKVLVQALLESPNGRLSYEEASRLVTF